MRTLARWSQLRGEWSNALIFLRPWPARDFANLASSWTEINGLNPARVGFVFLRDLDYSGRGRATPPALEAELPLGVGPGRLLLEARAIPERPEHFRGVFVRVLGMDRFPLGEAD